MLNRIIRYTTHGSETEADLRHAEIIVQQLGLGEAQPLTNPQPEKPKRPDDEVLLNAEYTTQYKSIAARANHLSINRPDMQFTFKKLATATSNPSNRNWQELKRLGRYLKGKPRLVIKYDCKTQSQTSLLTVIAIGQVIARPGSQHQEE